MLITENQLIRAIADRAGESPFLVRKIMSGLEDTLLSTLVQAGPDEAITIKVIPGLSIEGSFLPSRKIRHPRSGKTILTDNKIWARPKLTRYFNRKLNASCPGPFSLHQMEKQEVSK